VDNPKKLHEKLIILFATMLIKNENYATSRKVLEEYGRGCIKDKLARANIYKLLAFSSINTEGNGSEVQALKHCERAIEKFHELRCKDGEAQCLLVYAYIFQQTNAVVDAYDSENYFDESDEENNNETDFGYYCQIIGNFISLLKHSKINFSESKMNALKQISTDTINSECIIDLSPSSIASEFALIPIYK